MRLGPVQTVLAATINLGTNTTKSTETSFWTRIWNERDVQILVLTSLALQLFLLFAGNVRRWRRVSGLGFFVWLAYLASYAVGASAIGLFSQYEDKYKLRNQESPHLHTLTLPFLWAPFLLLHLGGPDTITSFSIEDNNLWPRQFISLASQLGLALYVFWKSFDLLDWQLLKVAIPLFVAGIIKYGERIWAFKSGSRDNLNNKTMRQDPSPQPGDDVASYAVNLALHGKGLLVGRTLSQLEDKDKLVNGFEDINRIEEDKLKIVLMELGMIYDMLYTKAMLFQSWIGILVRSIAVLAMLLAFVLFWINQHLRADATVNSVITYILLSAAIFVELYSIFMMIASPLTRANKGKFLCSFSHKLAWCFPSQWSASPSMGQFNLTDYSWSKKSTPKLISKVSEALGLEKHWRNVWYVKHVEDKEIIRYIVGLFDLDPNRPKEQSWQLELGQEQALRHCHSVRLRNLLDLSFEDAIFCLHILTEFHLTEYCSLEDGASNEMKELVAAIRKLSNYLMYLMVVYPATLLVSSAAQDFEPEFTKWVRDDDDNSTRVGMLRKYAEDKMFRKYTHRYPFEGYCSVESLKEIKMVWARVLIYAAGKCPMEMHARLLGNGVELLTVVGLLMMHRDLGVVGNIKFTLRAPSSWVLVPRQEAGEYRTPLLPGEAKTINVNGLRTSIVPNPKCRHPHYAFKFQDEPSTSRRTDEAVAGPSAPTRSAGEPSTSGGTNVAMEIEQAAGHQ